MDMIRLPQDFRDFLKLLNCHDVRYLIVGGYAVGYHGYPRATGEMDIRIELSENNSKKIFAAFRDFGMSDESISQGLFLEKNKAIRMGVPPVRLEIITGASGVNFEECYSNREVVEIDGILINFISLQDLKKNKKAAGRHKDLEDLEHLP